MGESDRIIKRLTARHQEATPLPMLDVSNTRLAGNQGNQKENTHKFEGWADISGGWRPCSTEKRQSRGHSGGTVPFCTHTQHRAVLRSPSQGFSVRRAPADGCIIPFKSWNIFLVKCKNSAFKANSELSYARLPGPSELLFSVD